LTIVERHVLQVDVLSFRRQAEVAVPTQI
jgi:hypothetical protein